MRGKGVQMERDERETGPGGEGFIRKEFVIFSFICMNKQNQLSLLVKE